MRASAPGKLVLTGAYAVLEGAPAIVVAVNRRAIADGAKLDPSPSIELRAAMERAPAVDVSALYEGETKLGLGSSAAALVAALAVTRPFDRDRIFEEAREAHARAQGGGSGVDVAASTYGGALRYRMGSRPEPFALPVSFRAYFSGRSARTSELVTRVRGHDLRDLARASLAAASASTAEAFIDAARRFERALEDLGRAADLGIVPHPFADLARMAEAEGGAFLPSGAGGGDVGAWLGEGAPSPKFESAAIHLGLRALDLSLDPDGVLLSSEQGTP